MGLQYLHKPSSLSQTLGEFEPNNTLDIITVTNVQIPTAKILITISVNDSDPFGKTIFLNFHLNINSISYKFDKKPKKFVDLNNDCLFWQKPRLTT